MMGIDLSAVDSPGVVDLLHEELDGLGLLPELGILGEPLTSGQRVEGHDGEDDVDVVLAHPTTGGARGAHRRRCRTRCLGRGAGIRGRRRGTGRPTGRGADNDSTDDHQRFHPGESGTPNRKTSQPPESSPRGTQVARPCAPLLLTSYRHLIEHGCPPSAQKVLSNRRYPIAVHCQESVAMRCIGLIRRRPCASPHERDFVWGSGGEEGTQPVSGDRPSRWPGHYSIWPLPVRRDGAQTTPRRGSRDNRAGRPANRSLPRWSPSSVRISN